MLGGLTHRSLVCFTIAFALGILALDYPQLAAVVAATGILGLGWAALKRRSALPGIALLGLAALAGALLARAHRQPGATDVSRLPSGGQTLVGTVANAPRYSRGRWSFVLDVEQHVGATREPVSGRCYVYFATTLPVHRGERWQLTGRLFPVQGPRNPGGPSQLRRLSSMGVRTVLSVGDPALAERLGQGDLGWVAGHAYTAQRRALSLLERHVRGPYPALSAQVAGSVIFGVYASPPAAEITEVFRRAGTIHLLVVSGAMVSSVFALVFLPGVLGARWRQARLRLRTPLPVSGRGGIRYRPGLWAALAAVLVTSYYAIITEGGQAVARAAIMGGLVGLAMMLRRVPRVARQHGLSLDPYTLLAAAALTILAVRPAALLRPGFQLSFAAVWAIIYFIPRADLWLASLPRFLRQAVIGTAAAQFATFPILAWHYGNAPAAGLAANLVAIPLAGVVLTAGMLTCALGVTIPWLAWPAGWITGWAARGMVWASSVCAAVPWASPEVGKPHIALVIAWYGALIWAGWWMGQRRPPQEENDYPA